MARWFPRKVRRVTRRLRMTRVVAKALQSRRHPVLAQIVPTRRCNLACEYCNEFDSTSAPIPLEIMLDRIDRLAALGTAMVDLSGGEPMLHPGLEQIVRRIRSHGMFAGLLTNGYLLTRARIAALNDAGLDRLQMSIDNVLPDAVSHKSLKVLDQKLRWLAEDAAFDVNVNTVLGAGVRNPADALLIAKRALSLGFGTSVGLIHDRAGQLAPLDRLQRAVYDELQDLERGFYSHAHDRLFQENLIRGTANEWQCGAGARYLYVCEDGLVHWCSQQRGYPGVPLAQYGADDLDREYASVKSCAPHCTVSCVHRVALVDAIRDRPLATLQQLGDAARATGRRPPRSVSVLTWMFVTGAQRDLFRRLAVRALNATRGL
jgi:MoaA/NifB/PqqE/SkfB family radical SAM enzyme